MKLTQIRNATLLLDYAGKKFLIDPMLAEKEAWPGFAGNARPHLRNPMVELLSRSLHCWQSMRLLSPTRIWITGMRLRSS